MRTHFWFLFEENVTLEDSMVFILSLLSTSATELPIQTCSDLAMMSLAKTQSSTPEMSPASNETESKMEAAQQNSTGKTVAIRHEEKIWGKYFALFTTTKNMRHIHSNTASHLFSVCLTKETMALTAHPPGPKL